MKSRLRHVTILDPPDGAVSGWHGGQNEQEKFSRGVCTPVVTSDRDRSGVIRFISSKYIFYVEYLFSDSILLFRENCEKRFSAFLHGFSVCRHFGG